MYKLTFTLQQHTPIIHFQHDQEGATLRATEVKPKLDRFISTVLGNSDYNKGINIAKSKNWLISEPSALNYKITFTPDRNQKTDIQSFHRNAPMYFANLRRETQKHFVMAKSIKVIIASFVKDLIDCISQYICQFFSETDFGTRQSKGYGSFEITEINEKPVTYEPQNYKFRFEIKTTDWQETLMQINLFYKSLRSGINEISRQNYSEPHDDRASKQIQTISRFYFKPLIFLYAKHLNKQWDKRTIKQTYFASNYIYRRPSSKERNQFGDDRIEELSFFRQKEKYPASDILSFLETKKADDFFLDFKDVFGLSSSEEWGAYDKTIIKGNATDNSSPANFREKDKKSPDLVERFHSPIQFKPLGRKDRFIVYVNYKELPIEYKGQKFVVYDNKLKSNPRLCLQIPDSFTFQEFFSFLLNKVNFDITKHVEKKFQREAEFVILENIYSQIQTA